MSARTFSQLFQAERKIFSAFHQQDADKQNPAELNELLKPLIESEDIPAKASIKSPQRNSTKVNFVSDASRNYKVTGLLDLPVRTAIHGEAVEDGKVSELEPTISAGRGIPFVSYVPDDLVALCSSGGGIRSAIFNLGVLQGLDKLGLLPLLDYHSTVSGGGYIGGWWSTWRANNSKNLLPIAGNNLVEVAGIRRLRERSRFLSPTGFALSAEIWSGLFLWMIGLVGTLMMAFSIIGLAVSVWSSLRFVLPWIGLSADYSHLLVLFASAITCALFSAFLEGKLKTSTRFLGVSFFLAACSAWALDGIWNLAIKIGSQHPYLTIGSALTIAGSSSGLIRLLSGWVAKREETKASGRFTTMISRYLPQLLAILVLGSMAFLLVYLMYCTTTVFAPHEFVPFIVFTLITAFLGQLLVGVPSTLHCFYRSRIEESFLRVPVENETQTSPAQEWPDRALRPLHVVNCCASDTNYSTTDQMDRLGISVCLSAVGAYPSACGVMPTMANPSLGEAITASAAAVDPSMGIYSAKLGRLVAFVLFAFNLRLGIWWKPNRALVSRKNHLRHFFTNRLSWRPWKEMLSQISLPIPTTDPDHKGYAASNLDIRLTDGGHFDNLAAYEMIRRRCRYIIICDGGADPDNRFVELASLQRLVRRDFGVEIDIDLDPLRTDAAGKSLRHLAAGRIRYPSSSTNQEEGFPEDGILIYVKPGLTGDEPEDLTQYQATNPSFPHETTTDQFFDNHQWEAYRKLGEHSITKDLGFTRKYNAGNHSADPKLAARLFDAAIRELGSEDHQLRSNSSGAATRFAERVADKPEDWVDELLSELCTINQKEIRDRARKSLLNTMGLLEAHEEAYYSLELKKYGDHLENWGIENRADRIAESAEVRKWWPIIASLYSIPFRNYLGSKYGLNKLLPIINRSLATLRFEKLSDYSSDFLTPKSIRRIKRAREGRVDEENGWVLHAICTIDQVEVDLGALAFSLSKVGHEIEIGIDDLQVAPGYWSIGHNSILIDALLDCFGFEVAGSANGSKPKFINNDTIAAVPINKIIVRQSNRYSSAVMRPDQRHSWILRGFIQTRSGFLMRDQKEQKLAGIYCNI